MNQSTAVLLDASRLSIHDPRAVRNRLNELVKSGEITMHEIEKGTTYSSSVVSQYLADKYEGDTAKIENAMRRYLVKWILKNSIIQTKTVDEINAMLMMSWKRLDFTVILGNFGRGKTKAASKFTLQNPEFAAFVDLWGIQSPMELISRTAAALNIEGQLKGTRTDRLNAIIRNLQRQPKLLIYDEADTLSTRTLDIIRYIHGEQGEERCAVVLIGTQKLASLLKDPSLGYLKSRITLNWTVGEISREETKKFVDTWDHDLTPAEIRTIHDWAAKRYSVRSIVNLMINANSCRERNGHKLIESDDLDQAYLMTGD